MMKAAGLIVGVTLLLNFANVAQAGVYVGINGGVTSGADSDISLTVTLEDLPEPIVGEGETSWDNGFWASAVVGYGVESIPVRMEGEVFYQSDDADESSAFGITGEIVDERSSYGVLANLYFDFENNTIFTPFIGAGLGAALVDIEVLTDDFSSLDSLVFAWHVGGGIALELSESLFIDVKYRYFMTEDITDTVANNFDTGDFLSQEIENSMHSILAGIRVEF